MIQSSVCDLHHFHPRLRQPFGKEDLMLGKMDLMILGDQINQEWRKAEKMGFDRVH